MTTSLHNVMVSTRVIKLRCENTLSCLPGELESFALFFSQYLSTGELNPAVQIAQSLDQRSVF